MSKEDEKRVKSFLFEKLKIVFEVKKHQLGGWGKADNWAILSDNTYLFVETETSQHHPNTNVLKLWPFLAENVETRILLVQTFFINRKNVNSSRARLAMWIAEKMKSELGDRFEYLKLVLPYQLENTSDTDIQYLRNKLTNFIKVQE